MSSDPVIRLENLGKCYHIYEKPRDRLLQMLARSRKTYFREFWALSDISLDVHRGECLGVIGRNGAGKSTLLQLVCGTLAQTHGTISVQGRAAGLLELGAGFNPDFTGRENVYLSASVLGLSHAEITERYEEIVDFSGIRDFIDQPVKTYSSGMYVRLAFSVATSVDPDILVIDEALSVGDGAFARKSFDRIMGLRDRGVTLLFCSHSMYHVEAICNRACWLEQGRLKQIGDPAEVTSAFAASLSESESRRDRVLPLQSELRPDHSAQGRAAKGSARLISVQAFGDSTSGRQVKLRSKESNLLLRIEFACDPDLPPPALAVGIFTRDGQSVTSTGSLHSDVVFQQDAQGRGAAEVVFPRLPLLKGDYTVSVFLTCERILHVYDAAERYIEFSVTQEGVEQGLVVLPHRWRDLVADEEKPALASNHPGVE